MGDVRTLEDYRVRDTVSTLRALLKNAEAGLVSGAVVAWQTTDGRFHATTTGTYARDHIAALGAAGKLFARINEAEESQGDR